MSMNEEEASRLATSIRTRLREQGRVRADDLLAELERSGEGTPLQRKRALWRLILDRRARLTSNRACRAIAGRAGLIAAALF